MEKQVISENKSNNSNSKKLKDIDVSNIMSVNSNALSAALHKIIERLKRLEEGTAKLFGDSLEHQRQMLVMHEKMDVFNMDSDQGQMLKELLNERRESVQQKREQEMKTLIEEQLKYERLSNTKLIDFMKQNIDTFIKESIQQKAEEAKKQREQQEQNLIKLVNCSDNILDLKNQIKHLKAESQVTQNVIDANFVKLEDFDAFVAKVNGINNVVNTINLEKEQKSSEKEKEVSKISANMNHFAKDIQWLKENKADKREFEHFSQVVNSVKDTVKSSETTKDVYNLEFNEIKEKLEQFIKSQKSSSSKTVELESKNVRQQETLDKMEDEYSKMKQLVDKLSNNISLIGNNKLDIFEFNEAKRNMNALDNELKNVQKQMKSSNVTRDMDKLTKSSNDMSKLITSIQEKNVEDINLINENIKKCCTQNMMQDIKVSIDADMETLKDMLLYKLDQKVDKKDMKQYLDSLKASLSPDSFQNEIDEEPMFTKKQLLSPSCASCDGKIKDGLTGERAEFQSWYNFPKSNEYRISHYAPGFSRMLSMIKKEDEMRRTGSAELFQKRNNDSDLIIEKNVDKMVEKNSKKNLFFKTYQNISSPKNSLPKIKSKNKLKNKND